MGDRRFATRVPRTDTADLRWQDQAGQAQEGVAQLADISASGASLRSPRPLRMGAPIIFRYQAEDFPAIVRHCVKRGAIYIIGIEFEVGHRWSLRAK